MPVAVPTIAQHATGDYADNQTLDAPDPEVSYPDADPADGFFADIPAPRRLQAGWPTRNQWEEGEINADPTFRTDAAVLAYNTWLANDRRTTFEVWDITEPALPTLLCAWMGTGDRGTYQQMTKFTMGSLERGFRADKTNPGSGYGTPEGAAAVRQMQRFLNYRQWQTKTGVYADAAVKAVELMARERRAIREPRAA